MAVSPETGAQHAAPVVDVMSRLELQLLEDAVKALAGDVDHPNWAAHALAQIAHWRAEAVRGVAGAAQELGKAVRTALLQAHADGAAGALVDLPGAASVPPLSTRGVHLSIDRLTKDLATVLQSAPRVLEAHLKEAVRAAGDQVRTGTVTRRAASQRVLDQLIKNGITGFRDSAGRNWSLATYTEMAVRTETAAVAMEAAEQRVLDLGYDSVVVSDSPRECPLCRPFEGKVLKIKGIGPGTLAGARARGFQHPNCTHAIYGHRPGSKTSAPHANPDGYEEKQHQRYLERQVRQWKRAQVVAITPEAKQRAALKVRDWQTELRDYVKAHDLKRQSGRESISKAI